jgi:hypothetical protein
MNVGVGKKVRISIKSVIENVFTIISDVFGFIRQSLIARSKVCIGFGARPWCKTNRSEILSTLLNPEPKIRMRGDLPPRPNTIR